MTAKPKLDYISHHSENNSYFLDLNAFSRTAFFCEWYEGNSLKMKEEKTINNAFLTSSD